MREFKIQNEEKNSILRTIRIRSSLMKRIEDLSISSGVSVNKIINESILFALEHLETQTKKNKKVNTR